VVLVLFAIGGTKLYEPLGYLLPGATLLLLAWPKRPVMLKRQPPQES
jgi:hypothetical protein